MKLGRPPMTPVLPITMIGISARPVGSSGIKLHRLPECAEGGATPPGDRRRAGIETNMNRSVAKGTRRSRGVGIASVALLPAM